jgi:hypothetical protein
MEDADRVLWDTKYVCWVDMGHKTGTDVRRIVASWIHWISFEAIINHFFFIFRLLRDPNSAMQFSIT